MAEQLSREIEDLRELTGKLRNKLRVADAARRKAEVSATARDNWASMIFAQTCAGVIERWLPTGTMLDQIDFVAKASVEAAKALDAATRGATSAPGE